MKKFSIWDKGVPTLDPTLGEPLIWIEEIEFYDSLDNPCLRRIEFKRGLNIIATEPPVASDVKSVGHDVGKTTLVRLIRYCLGEEHFCDGVTQAAVDKDFEDGYVLAKFRVNKKTWCVCRPLFGGAGYHGSWARPCTDLHSIKKRLPDDSYSVFANALNELYKKVFSPIGLRYAENRHARWLDLLGWLSRDQDRLFGHQAEWRVTQSNAGPRVLNIEDAYMVMRMSLDLFAKDEAKAISELGEIEEEIVKHKLKKSRIESWINEARKDLVKSCKTKNLKVGRFLGGSLFVATIKNKAEQKQDSLFLLQEDMLVRPKSDLSKLLDNALIEYGRISARKDDIANSISEKEKAIDEIDHQSSDAFATSLGAEGFECRFWPGDREEARRNSCPGVLRGLDQDRDHEKFQRLQRKKQLSLELSVLQKTRNEIIPEFEDANKTKLDLELRCNAERRKRIQEDQNVSVAIGHWEAIVKQAERLLRVYEEDEGLVDKILDGEKEARLKKAEIKDIQKSLIDRKSLLSQCYNSVVHAIVSERAEGRILVDGNGVTPDIAKETSSGTTLKTCSKVLAFDFACEMASLCGMGYLPRFWIHDSPRAADTEDPLYHQMIDIVRAFEDLVDDESKLTFQHIWTTTSQPPDHLNKKPYVRDRLHARDNEGLLLKRKFGVMEQMELI